MNALAIGASVPVVQAQLAPESFARFDRIPARHSVEALGGFVVVYDQEFAGRWPLEDGALYVIEHQRPRAGMSWETMMLHRIRRIETRREVVRGFQRPDIGGWWYGHAHGAGPAFEGPMEDFNLADMIVGKVVGIYSDRRARQDV